MFQTINLTDSKSVAIHFATLFVFPVDSTITSIGCYIYCVLIVNWNVVRDNSQPIPGWNVVFEVSTCDNFGLERCDAKLAYLVGTALRQVILSQSPTFQ